MTARPLVALDDFPALSLFVEVVRSGSFSRAARRRGLSTSAVSKRIAQLEARLGLRLLARTTRQLSLTDGGRRLLARAEGILAELGEAERELFELGKGPKGVLRVATSVGLGQSHVGRVSAEFASRHAEVELQLSIDERLVDLVAERFDVAVRCGSPRDSKLTIRKLVPARRVLTASPSYLARRGTPRRLLDLRQHDCLCHVLEDGGRRWKLEEGPRSSEVQVNGAFHSDNPFVLRDAAVAGAGVAFLPNFVIAEDLRAGRLAPVLESLAAETGWVYLAFTSPRPSKLSRAYSDYVGARLQEALR